jgi:hypothetical protein
MDVAMLRTLGEWVEIEKEAIYLPRPSGIAVDDNGRDKDFILKNGNCYYLFYNGLVMSGDANVVISVDHDSKLTDRFEIDGRIASFKWLDDGSDVAFEQSGNKITVSPGSFRYGIDLVVRVAKIETE